MMSVISKMINIAREMRLTARAMLKTGHPDMECHGVELLGASETLTGWINGARKEIADEEKEKSVD